jgi:tRNA(fMet)-specific endonuclease VapC
MYLLDADTLSFLVRREPGVLARFVQMAPESLWVSTVTLMEVEFGLVRQPAKRAKVEKVLRMVVAQARIVPFTELEATTTARVRASLASSGRPIGPYDVMLAGTALAHALTVVSGNLREFRRIDGLVCEDWRVAP